MFSLRTHQILNCDLETAWNFVSSPRNLARITPEYMGFETLTPDEELKSMYPGQIIEYYVKPILGIKIHWVTEITHVKEGEYFVDEQRKGPYKIWHHQHFLKPVIGGVEMSDIVHYQLPGGVLGKLIHTLGVRKQLQGIFHYREEVLKKIFSEPLK